MIGMSLSIGLGIGSMLDDSVIFYPTSVGGCIAFWDPNVAATLTYSTTPKSSGPGTPPSITFSYSAVLSPTAIRIEATGTTTWKWGPENDGSTANFGAGATGLTIVPGSTVALGTTGVSAVFPASGTYANTQAWETTLSSIVSVNSSHVLAQATASKQPKFLKLLGSNYGWKTDGTDDTLINTTIDRPSPSTTPTFFWGAYRPDRTGVSFDTVFSANNGAAGQILCGRSFGVYGSYLTNGTTVATISSSNVFGRHYASFTGSTADAQKFGSVAVSTGSNAGGTDPSAGISYGSRGDSASTFSADSWLYTGIWDQTWSSGSLALGDSYSTSRSASISV